MTNSSESKTERHGQPGYVVLNPVAGDGEPEALEEAVRRGLSGVEYDLYKTTGDESIPDVVRQALDENDYAWVAAAGGDGTVSQVADAVAGSDIPFGIIPAGTGNALAGALGLPEDVEEAAALVAAAPATRTIDAMKYGDRTYFLQVGAGLESMTMEETSSDEKNRWGVMAYLKSAIQQATGWQPHQFTLTVDGQTETVEASEVVVANAADIGVLDLEWDETITLDDGRLNIALIQARSFTDTIKALGAILLGRQRESEEIEVYAVSDEVTIESEEADLPVHGDGELLERDWPIHIEVLRNALRVIVPEA